VLDSRGEGPSGVKLLPDKRQAGCDEHFDIPIHSLKKGDVNFED
jgi:hypothetical protein